MQVAHFLMWKAICKTERIIEMTLSTQTIIATNIQWDTDGDKQVLTELPKEVEIPTEVILDALNDNEDAISDYLSDEYGYCHSGYNIEIVDKEQIEININNGTLIAKRNPDPDFDGFRIMVEKDNGDTINVVLTECKEANDKKKIDVYTYENIDEKDYTRKYSLDIE